MTAHERLAQRGERLNELTRCDRDSAMGKLLRMFWQPFALGRELAPGKAKPVRLLAEDLTVYRSASGRPYLVGGRCAHRVTALHTGWVEGEEIRCMYHGWKYDGTGQCTLRPAELDGGLPNVKIAGYPVHEYAGFLFAYLGEGPPPPFELPRKDCFERAANIFPHKQVWPCNWFQCTENSLDALHVSFVHAHSREGQLVQSLSQAIPELEYFETESGIRQIATRGPGNRRIGDWTFPNNSHIIVPGPVKDGPWVEAAGWNVPMDDEHTMRMNVYSMESQGPERDEEIMQTFLQNHADYDPADHHEDLFFRNVFPEDVHSNLTNAQDYVALVGQGAIVDRTMETLGRSDAGVALLRRICFRELTAIADGLPTKQWRRLDHGVELRVPDAVRTT